MQRLRRPLDSRNYSHQRVSHSYNAKKIKNSRRAAPVELEREGEGGEIEHRTASGVLHKEDRSKRDQGHHHKRTDEAEVDEGLCHRRIGIARNDRISKLVAIELQAQSNWLLWPQPPGNEHSRSGNVGQAILQR